MGKPSEVEKEETRNITRGSVWELHSLSSVFPGSPHFCVHQRWAAATAVLVTSNYLFRQLADATRPAGLTSMLFLLIATI
jgi:hypothetical protein